MDGTPSSGTEYYFSAQLIGSGIFKPGDMFTAALRYAALNDSNVYVFDFNSRYPLTGDFRISPRLRLGYRTGTTTDLKEKTILPSILLDYLLTKDINLELEAGPKWILSEEAGTKTTTMDLEVTLGLRYDFHADGSHKCARVLGPCSPVGLAGLPASGSEASDGKSSAAFYKSDPASSTFIVDAGLRYWHSTARNRYSYYADPTPTLEVSRLSYDGLGAHSGELYFRADAGQRSVE